MELVAELALRARNGNDHAFESLYRRFAQSVHAVLLAHVPADAAEELIQEVFTRAHRRLGRLRDLDAVGPWLHAIARNAAIDHLRARARRPTQQPLPELAETENSDDRELREVVMLHIGALPETYRITLLMRLVEGLSGPEIAEQTGLTPASVRVNLHRGFELLRARMQQEQRT
jgi:RNA polymerase sigma-70 factor, ECF subfamily